MNSLSKHINLSHESLATFIDNLPGVAWIIDSEGKFYSCNTGLSNLVNRTKDEIIGATVISIFGEKLAEICRENRLNIAETGKNQEFIQSIKTRGGNTVDFLINEFPITTDEGKSLYGGIGIDISNQLAIESELKESKKKLSRLNRLYSVLSQINETIVRSNDKEALLEDVCKIIVAKAEIELAWIGIYQQDKDQLEPIASAGSGADYIKKVITNVNTGEFSNGSAALAIRTGMYATSNDVSSDPTLRLKSDAQEYHFKSCGVFPFDYGDDQRGAILIYSILENYFETEETQLFQSLADDISYAMQSLTSKSRADAASAQLSIHQRQLATLFSNLPGMAYRRELDDNWTMNFISEGCLEVTGYHPEELVDNRAVSFESLIHPDDRNWVRKDINLAVSRHTRYELTYRIQHRKKSERWVWERGQGVYDPHNQAVKLEGFITDVTDQQLAYSRMQTQAELIDQAHDAIIACSEDGTILFWNQGATRLYGFSRKDVEGRKINEILKTPGERRADAIREVRRAGEWSGELIRVCADGSEKTVESRWTTSTDENDNTILTIDSDITERRNLEKQFLRAQRMESVGNLAGGVAHDLNNILSPIMMSAELLEDYITGEQERKILTRISDGARRAADLVQQLLSFSRGLDSSRKTIEIEYLLPDLKNLARDAVTENIRLEFQIESDLPQIRANPIQINQVLLNLCVNARDAMNGSGELFIRIYKNVKTQVPPEIIPGNFVVFEVKDTGKGIPEELREQIFEPFFTTKQESEGTGLGLSTSLSIIQNHGGFIDISSTLGKGSIFRVFLPALGMRLETEEESSEHSSSRESSMSILVVDDESTMRSVLARSLEKMGYRVLTASNGREALDQLEKNPNLAELVLTDINMPVLNGIDLSRAIREKFPELPIIAMSGFEKEQNMNRKIDSQDLFDHFLSKPFSIKDLKSALERSLSQ